MDETPPPDEKALETRRERTVATFQARMSRWQAVQAAAFAIGTVGLLAYLADQLTVLMFVLALVAAALATAVSAGVQSGYEAAFMKDMDAIERAFERLKRGGLNP